MHVRWGRLWGGVVRNTMLPDSVLARAKMKMAFGQAELVPSSRSLRVLEPEPERNCRTSSVLVSGVERAMGVATAKLASMEIVRSFMMNRCGRLSGNWL